MNKYEFPLHLKSSLVINSPLMSLLRGAHVSQQFMTAWKHSTGINQMQKHFNLLHSNPPTQKVKFIIPDTGVAAIQNEGDHA